LLVTRTGGGNKLAKLHICLSHYDSGWIRAHATDKKSDIQEGNKRAVFSLFIRILERFDMCGGEEFYERRFLSLFAIVVADNCLLPLGSFDIIQMILSVSREARERTFRYSHAGQ